jgi:S1-C subfamily serine protease
VAQHFLGNAYFFGRAVPKQPATALVWYGRAADQDHPESIHALGEIHFNGLGVGKDEVKGVEYYRRAADRNVPASQEKLAELSWNGRAMPTDRVKAVEYARKAAQARRPGAQFLLGVALLTGEGVEKNPTEAVSWFRRAADQGHPQSQHNLGITLISGTGVAKNMSDGYFWLALSAERAPANLKAAYEKDRDNIGAKLTPAEVAQLRARVAAWKPVQTGNAPAVAALQPNTPTPITAQPKPPPGQSGPATVIAPPEGSTQRSATSTGTGFLVSRDGTILTNAHVVEQCRTITVKPAEGPALVAAITAKDSGDDMALLKTSLRLNETARFREDKPMRSGDDVVVIGFPLSSLLSREANVTAGVISAMAGLHGDVRHYQITAPVQKGNSGGPLVDASGNIIGIVSSKLNAMKIAGQTGDIPQNVNFAIKSDLARKFMDRYSVSYETAPAGPVLSAADIGERIKRVTVFIQCKVN